MENAHWLMEPQPLGLHSYYLFIYFIQTEQQRPSPQPHGVNLSQQNPEKRSCKSKNERKEKNERRGKKDGK